MNEKCFAEADRGKCAVLTVHQCPGHEKCSFYKTEEQAKAENKKAYERIVSLPYDRQQYIAGCYYGGKMPWYVKG